MSLRIHKPGIQASIQDAGRLGYQHWGVPVGGAMDILSMQAANLICGNDLSAAVIECTLHGTLIEFQEPHQFTVTGGGAIATLNNRPISFNELISASTGDLFQLHPNPNGCRSYIAVCGGFAIEPDLNSCSTYPPAKLGGINGDYLKAGDTLAICTRKNGVRHQALADTNNSSHEESNQSILKKAKNNAALTQKEVTIKIHRGPEWDWFDLFAKENLLKKQWVVGNNANRMAYLLNGPALQKIDTQELVSTAVTRGIIQVTTSGQPIILMADAQTIGGYPRIAWVCSNDLPILAQCRPGAQLNFQLQELVDAIDN